MKRRCIWLAFAAAAGGLAALRGPVRSQLVRLFGTEIGQVRDGAVADRRR